MIQQKLIIVMRLVIHLYFIGLVLSNLDYYDTLEIAKDFSQNELDKAYKRLSNRYHPSSNPGNREAAKRYEDIQRAYTILNDNNLRSILSRYGEDMMRMVERHRKAGRNSDEQRTEDIIIRWGVSLEQLYAGDTLKYTYSKYYLP
jgi:DnaJ-class molecular chaperone